MIDIYEANTWMLTHEVKALATREDKVRLPVYKGRGYP